MTRRKGPATNVLHALTIHQWAITEEALATMLSIAERENESVEAVAAKLGRPLDNTHAASVRDGVATIPVVGPMVRYADIFVRVSGATSYETLATDLRAALDDPAVRAVLFDVDSPGGEVNGVAELAAMIHGARQSAGGAKPVVAFVSGAGASAAYWLASAADEVVVSPTATLGSIGAVISLEDRSEQAAARGVKRYRFVSSQSPRKAMDPADPQGRADIQTTVDALAQVFVVSVAANRGVSEAVVLSDFGQGALFVGEDAVAAGLADRVSTYEALHAELAQRAGGGPAARILAAPRARAVTTPTTLPMATETPTTPVADADDPALAAAEPQREPAEPTTAEATPDAPADPAMEAAHRAAQMVADVAERYPGAVLAFRAQGAERERARVLGIQALGGDAATLAACVADPACTREQAALRLVEAGAHTRGTHLAALRGDDASFTHPAPLAEDGTPAPGGPDATAQRVLATFAAVAPAPRRLPASR